VSVPRGAHYDRRVIVRTVLGDIPPADLGACDAHEHLFLDTPAQPGDEFVDVGMAVEEAQPELRRRTNTPGSQGEWRETAATTRNAVSVQVPREVRSGGGWDRLGCWC